MTGGISSAAVLVPRCGPLCSIPKVSRTGFYALHIRTACEIAVVFTPIRIES